MHTFNNEMNLKNLNFLIVKVSWMPFILRFTTNSGPEFFFFFHDPHKSSCFKILRIRIEKNVALIFPSVENPYGSVQSICATNGVKIRQCTKKKVP